MLQTKTARFFPDGEVDVGYSYVPPYKRYLFTLQATDWLEATFRYSDVRNRTFFGVAPITAQGENESFKDRGLDFKLKLLDEGRYRPALAVGFQDALGTGVFAGEYIVLGKRFYDLDFSLGLAWGYLGKGGSLKNPLASISDAFNTRSDDFGLGGTLGFGNWFSGQTVALFGGVQYDTPVRGISLKLEYDGNDYKVEPLGNRFIATSRINYGLAFRAFPWLDLSVARERGNRVMFRVSLRANLHDPGIPKFQNPPPPAISVRPAARLVTPTPPVADQDLFSSVLEIRTDGPVATAFVGQELTFQQRIGLAKLVRAEFGETIESAQVRSIDGSQVAITQLTEGDLDGTGDIAVLGDGTIVVSFTDSLPVQTPVVDTRWMSAEAAQDLFADLRAAGIRGNFVDFQGATMIVQIEPRRYLEVATSIGRAARVLSAHAPPEIELFEIAYYVGGVELSRTTMLRRDFEAVATFQGSPEEILGNASIEPGKLSRQTGTTISNPKRFPGFRWSANPNLRQHVGGGDRFYAFQLYLALKGVVEVAPGLTISGTVGKDIYNNFDELFVEPPGTNLPRVRSLVKDYLQQGEDNIIRLQADYVRRLGEDVYGRLSSGIFEEMYGGVGGEILFEPQTSRFAVGLDINYVRQRDFEQLFGFLDYSVVTGHLNLYYDIPVLDLDAEVNVGRYLARDQGATFQLARRFRNGMRVGGFFTLTDVPFSVFGEGSFDKGLFLTIPLELLQASSSRSVGGFAFRPLTKDGGQKLGVGPRLHALVSEGSLMSILEDWDELLD